RGWPFTLSVNVLLPGPKTSTPSPAARTMRGRSRTGAAARGTPVVFRKVRRLSPSPVRWPPSSFMFPPGPASCSRLGQGFFHELHLPAAARTGAGHVGVDVADVAVVAQVVDLPVADGEDLDDLQRMRGRLARAHEQVLLAHARVL